MSMPKFKRWYAVRVASKVVKETEVCHSQKTSLMRVSKVPLKLGNRGSSSPLYIVRVCTNTRVPHPKNGSS
jgi:hypothetical protein